MFKTHKTEFIEKYNNLNYSKMLLSVAFCFDAKFCAKAIKALAHKKIKISLNPIDFWQKLRYNEIIRK